jgi:putative endonuclease
MKIPFRRYYVYILECSDKTYYTGITYDLEKRLLMHNTGYYRSCYTYDKRPVILRFYEMYADVNLAIQWEKRIKKWSRRKKEALIHEKLELLPKLSKKHFS